MSEASAIKTTPTALRLLADTAEVLPAREWRRQLRGAGR
jgi:hypothetical protein